MSAAHPIRCFLVSALLAGVSCVGHGQKPTQATPPHPASAPAQQRLVLYVQANDGRDQPITGLTGSDFQVSDNRHSIPIQGFRAINNTAGSATPDQILFVIDAVNLSFIGASNARTQLANFLRKYSGSLPAPVSIALLTDTNLTISGDPTRDRETLAADLDKASSGIRSISRSAAFYGAVERLDLSTRALEQLTAYEKARPGRKLMVWLSSGWPYLASPGTNYSKRGQQYLFNTIVKFSTNLRESGTTLYDVDPVGSYDAGGFQTMYYRGFLKGIRREQDAAAANLGLQVLAVQSGGVVLNSLNDIPREIGQCTTDDNSYYQIVVPAATAAHPNEYHELSVTVTKPNIKARTNTGYYAQP